MSKENKIIWSIAIPIALFLILINSAYGATYGTDELSGITCDESTFYLDNPTYDCTGAFDRAGEGWTSKTSYPHWLKIDTGGGNELQLRQYGLTFTGDSGGRATAWTFSGSNDDSNWQDLDEQTGQTMGESEIKYQFENETAYRYYKWNFTAGAGAYVQLNEAYGYECVSECTASTTMTTSTITMVDSTLIFIQYILDAIIILGVGYLIKKLLF